jgi:hypothetical protein
MKFIPFLYFNFFLIGFCFSQDVLIKISGDSTRVKIVEIGLTEVKYKNYDDLGGITYGIYKTEVLRIRYADGRVESFSAEELAKSMSPAEKCSCGRSDAENYHGMKGAGFACGAYCGPFAILGTAITRQTPKMGMRTARLSDHKALFQDPFYLKCYNKKAKADLMNMELQGLIAAIVVPIAIALLIYH